MPLEILTGADVPALLARAQKRLGEDAVVLSVRRVPGGGFEMVAADPRAAQQHAREQRARDARVRPVPAAPAILPQPAGPARAAASPGFWDVTRPAPAGERVANVPGPAAPRALWPFARPAARASRPRVIALVGPTGAGKTTTIAKLANHACAFGGQRVGLLCLDTYRIGAVEQLRQYAELSRVPFEAAWDPRDIDRAMKRLRDRDVVLVDTAGRGPRVAGDLRETQARLLRVLPDEVHLVLPAGLQRALARQHLSAHLPLGVTHLLPTKFDEYPEERGLHELAERFSLPMRWLADGQEVPADLQLATPDPAARPRVPHRLEAV